MQTEPFNFNIMDFVVTLWAQLYFWVLKEIPTDSLANHSSDC